MKNNVNLYSLLALCVFLCCSNLEISAINKKKSRKGKANSEALFSRDVLTSEKFPEFPANFRILKNGLKTEKKGIKKNQEEAKGLEKVNASGSSQFNAHNLKNIISCVQKIHEGAIAILDVREESHAFVNGIPFVWSLYPDTPNANKPVEEIEHDQINKLFDLESSDIVSLVLINEVNGAKKVTLDNVTVENVMTEKELAQKLGLGYIRIPVTDHAVPSIEAVDRFLAFYTSNTNRWIHAHCNAGKGRTTTFLTLIDMINNAKNVTFETLIKREQLLGGENLFAIDHKEIKRAIANAKRVELLREFYDFCKENNDDFETSFSAWLNNHKKKDVLLINETFALASDHDEHVTMCIVKSI